MTKEFVDVLVIGAGPSGCVSASYLFKNNVKVKVVEKMKLYGRSSLASQRLE